MTAGNINPENLSLYTRFGLHDPKNELAKPQSQILNICFRKENNKFKGPHLHLYFRNIIPPQYYYFIIGIGNIFFQAAQLNGRI